MESSIPGTDVVTSDKADVDGALVARIARGDTAALGELYDRHGRTVFGALYRMLGAPEPAEEVAQDTFHAVWRRAGTSDERGITTLTLSAAVASGDVVAVTPEPAGGVDAPTGTPVLAGKS